MAAWKQDKGDELPEVISLEDAMGWARGALHNSKCGLVSSGEVLIAASNLVAASATLAAADRIVKAIGSKP